MILFDIETCPSWQNREQLYILFPQLMCPSDQEKIMEYPHFSVQLSLQYLCLSSHRMVLKNTNEANCFCQDHPRFSSIYPNKGIPTVFISLYIKGSALGPIPNTGPRQHPDSVLSPLEQLINDKLPGPGVLDLNDCGLAVAAGLGHDEYFVVANDPVLFIFWGRFPNYP